MSALSSKSGEWQTPPWLVEKCRAALGGYISLDAANDVSNPTGAADFLSANDDALARPTWWGLVQGQRQPTLFLNPPGERSGKLIRRFWARWNYESAHFHAAVWVDFNLDHLRFIELGVTDTLVIPRKRMAFVDPTTGKERKGAQIGGFLLFRGAYREMDIHFPDNEYLHVRGPCS